MYIFILSDYLPTFRSCTWEENIVDVAGAKAHGECVDIQPEFSVSIMLLIAVVACVVATAIMNIFEPIFNVLDASNLEDPEYYQGALKEERHKKVVPYSRNTATRKGITYQISHAMSDY